MPRLSFLFLPLLLAAAPALAQEATPIDELEITATRLPTPAALAPDAQVIATQQIQLRQAGFAFDVLDTLPGVTVSRQGAFGGVTSVMIRGAPADKTLVLIDGAPVNDPTSPEGAFDFSSVDLEDISRIEVLSGPQGSLWGSDAIGGVVSITTREPNGWRASAEGGSFGGVRGTGALGFSNDRAALGADVGWFSTGGVSAADAADGNSERDGERSLSGQVNGRFTATDWLTLDAKARVGWSHVDLDSFGGPTGVIDGPDSQHGWMATGYLRARIEGPWGVDQELRVDGMDLDRIDDSFFGGADFPFEAKGHRLDWRWTAEKSDLGSNALLVGVERQDDHEDTGDGGRSAHDWGGFAVWRFTPSGPLSTTVSLRRDQPSGYAGVTTARVSAVLKLGAGFSLNGSYGQGFKAPSIFETTYPCFECTPPGPATNLKPEHAEGFDGGLVWRSPGGKVSASLTGYRLTIQGEIDYLLPQGYVNIDRARTTGAQAQVQAALGWGFGVRASYAYAHARDLSTGAPLLRVPARTGSVELDWTRGRAEAALVVRSQSQAQDVDGVIRPFTVANLSGAWRLNDHVQLTARLENLADVHYQEAFGFGEPGFGLFVGVRLRG
ncbi:MAG TPA: TonB-dependent receptor [Caulobacteraceae bacterium]